MGSLMRGWKWKTILLLAVMLLTLLVVGVAQEDLLNLFRSGESIESKAESLRQLLLRFGPLAPLIYVLFVTVEVVVAPLPGAFLYAPGGYCFGGLFGGLLSLVGNTLGAGIACLLMRRLSYDKVRRLLSPDWQQYQQRLGQHGFWLVVVLRLNPVTSSDMVSYAAGLTPMPVWQLMLATTIGMAPLCFFQAYFAAQVLTAFPVLLVPLAVACVLYLAVAIAVILKMREDPMAPEQQ